MSTVLILGASRGIGYALAEQYLADGWRVIGSVRQVEDAQKLKAIGVNPIQIDVNDLNDCASLGWLLDDEKIDVAILNAGVMGSPTDTLIAPSAEEFNQVMQTNVLAAMRILPIVAPLVQSTKGKLAVVSSAMGSLSARNGANAWLYRASKAALNSVLIDVALTYSDVTCIALHPGWVKTAMGGEQAPLSPEQSAQGMIKTLSQLTQKDSAQFYSYDGKKIAW